MKKILSAVLLTLLLAACNTEKESSDNGRYIYTGTLTVTDTQEAETYKASDMKFEITEQNDIISLVMNEVMFDNRMPQPFTIVITSLKSSLLPGGGSVLESTVTPIVPLVGGLPRKEFQIPSFTGMISGKDLEIEFQCVMAQYRLNHTAVFKGVRTN